MAGPSQSDLECMKILLPGLYVETLVSACFCVLNPICWGLPLGMNLSLYLAMLSIVLAKVAGYNGPGHRRSLETRALSGRWVEPGLVEGGGVPQRGSPVPPLGMEARCQFP